MEGGGWDWSVDAGISRDVVLYGLLTIDLGRHHDAKPTSRLGCGRFPKADTRQARRKLLT